LEEDVASGPVFKTRLFEAEVELFDVWRFAERS
jgi:hypothetical protein